MRMVPSGQPNPMGPGQQLSAPPCCGRAPASSALAPARGEGGAAASRAWRWLAAIPMFLQLERAWGCSRGGVAVAHDAAALPRPWHSPLPLRPLRQPPPLPALPGLLRLSSGSMSCAAASPSCLVRSASVVQVGLRHRLASSRDTKLRCRPCTAGQRPCAMAHISTSPSSTWTRPSLQPT